MRWRTRKSVTFTGTVPPIYRATVPRRCVIIASPPTTALHPLSASWQSLTRTAKGYNQTKAVTWLTQAAENAHASEWQILATAYSQDAQRKLTPLEQAAFRARLAGWRSALDDE
jgi:hypothetical protein